MTMIALLAASAAFNQELPAAVINGRFFYQPSVGAHRLRIWLDTDGSGFVTRRCVETLGLTVAANHTALPDPVMQPTALSGRLPVFDPDPADSIFAGIDAQFGATWFQGRTVSLDYPRGTFTGCLHQATRPRERRAELRCIFKPALTAIALTDANIPAWR